jgi:PHD/YefM family antitoxin component YafN of YafNO toxin-antitoxin module
MAATSLTSSEFDQNVSAAKEAALNGPVFLTDNGRPTHVLLTIEDYQRLTLQAMSLAEALAQPGVADFEFEPPRLDIRLKPADFD